MRNVRFFHTEEKAEKRLGVKGDKGIEIAFSAVERLIGGYQNRNGDADQNEAPDVKKCGKGKPQHTEQLHGVPQFPVLLGKARNGNDSHIKNDVCRKPADANGKFA